MDALNGVWSGTYILQIIIQKKLETLTKYLKKNWISRIQNFQSKLEIFTKLQKIIALASLVTKTSTNI